MLSGIKVGKKKKKAPPSPINNDGAALLEDSNTNNHNASSTGNAAVAAALRRELAAGESLTSEKQPAAASTILLPDRPTASYKKEEDMTMQELLVHEKSHMSLAEQETRSILRQKKRPRRAQVDSDGEEVIDDRHWKQPDAAKAARRDHDRQLAQHRRAGVTQSCWWWVESTRFAPDRTLLAASSNVTLVLNARAKGCLLPGKHFYLVPIPHAPSWTACEENVWVELRQFQKSLRAMAQAQDEAVLFWETVLDKGGGVWQTRMDVLFVPLAVAQDAPLYFRSALAEQAQEFGTHQKLMTIKKSLKASVPQNFPYFYVEYGEYDGHLQMIENKSFPSDFGLDTVAGMMELDPLRFRGNKAKVDEGKIKRDFLEKWSPFDWTSPSESSATTRK